MPLNQKFINAKIVAISAQAWKLSIRYSFYSLYEFEEVFVYQTLDEAKTRLILERCHNSIEIIDQTGKKMELKVSDG